MNDLPGESNTAAVAHAVTKNLAGDNVITGENRVQLLEMVSHKPQMLAEKYSRLR
jgi:hypothetical protein